MGVFLYPGLNEGFMALVQGPHGSYKANGLPNWDGAPPIPVFLNSFMHMHGCEFPGYQLTLGIGHYLELKGE